MFPLGEDPFAEFNKLLSKAVASGTKEPTAMSLATVGLSASGDLRPSLRTVLFKGLYGEAFSFFTNYNSQKAKEISANPQVSLLFFWQMPDQFQVRITGKAEKLSREESVKYFESRPRISQVGAWASHQSEKIESSEILSQRFQELDLKFGKDPIPCPPHWGGIGVIPTEIELWFGRPGRLHDRYIYVRDSVQQPWQHFQKNP